MSIQMSSFMHSETWHQKNLVKKKKKTSIDLRGDAAHLHTQEV